MEENTTYKNRIRLFACLSIILCVLINTLPSMIFNLYISDTATENYSVTQGAINLAADILSLVIYLLFGYSLTKSKRKAVVFTGSMYFGVRAAGVISLLITSIADSLYSSGIIISSVSTLISHLADFAVLPLEFYIAYFTFTAFEGLNPKFSQNLDASQLTLSKARPRYLVFDILGSFIISAVLALPNFIISFLSHNNGSLFLSDLLLKLTSWFSASAIIALIYFAGYSVFKNHIDGLAFSSCLGICGTIVSVITQPFFIVQYIVMHKLTDGTATSDNFAYVITVTAGGFAVSILSLAVSVLCAIYILKFFFSEAKITLFTEMPQFAPSPIDVQTPEQ